MARAHDTMMNPPIEELLDTVESKFSLVTLAARRARQINSYFNQLGDGLGHMVPPQVSSVARKPLSIGFEEIAAHKIVRDAIDLGKDAPGTRAHHAHDAFHERALAVAVGAEQHHRLASVYDQGDVLQHAHAAITRIDVGDTEIIGQGTPSPLPDGE